MSETEFVETGGLRFVCDAMLGGLARWLRAAGYDSSWQYGQEDAELIGKAQSRGAILLTSDGGIMERNIVRTGEVRAVFVPRGLDKYQQLAFVLGRLGLPLEEPRCMHCGGELRETVKEEARGKVPPRAWSFHEKFYRCGRCGRVLWRGTHWRRIAEKLAHIDEYYPEMEDERPPGQT